MGHRGFGTELSHRLDYFSRKDLTELQATYDNCHVLFYSQAFEESAKLSPTGEILTRYHVARIRNCGVLLDVPDLPIMTSDAEPKPGEVVPGNLGNGKNFGNLTRNHLSII